MAKKPKKLRPPWRPEAGSEDNIFGEDPRVPSGRKRKKKRAKPRRRA